MSFYQVIWYLLVGLLLAVYAVLDGFDLGVGFWYLFTRKEEDRRTLMKSIGPVWDGNEVWLITGGGALFAAFPPVYASVFSGFYLALMLVLTGLIFRAVALEFRNKEEGRLWRRTWDLSFGLGSSLVALLFGVALGNILWGLPLDHRGDYTGTFLDLLNPFSLLIGVLGFIMLIHHGALFIAARTSDGLAEQALIRSRWTGPVYLGVFLATVGITLVFHGSLLDNYLAVPVLFLIPLTTLAALVASLVFARRGQALRGFLASSASILGMWAMCGASLFPRLVPAMGAPERSLTLANSSSSELTLRTMLIMTLIGMPLVIGYTIWVYKTFLKDPPAAKGGY